MTVYTAMHVLFDYIKGNNLELLKSQCYILVPVVNIDGYTEIGELYHVSGFHGIRKNRHYYVE